MKTCKKDFIKLQNLNFEAKYIYLFLFCPLQSCVMEYVYWVEYNLDPH